MRCALEPEGGAPGRSRTCEHPGPIPSSTVARLGAHLLFSLSSSYGADVAMLVMSPIAGSSTRGPNGPQPDAGTSSVSASARQYVIPISRYIVVAVSGAAVQKPSPSGPASLSVHVHERRGGHPLRPGWLRDLEELARAQR